MHPTPHTTHAPRVTAKCKVANLSAKQRGPCHVATCAANVKWQLRRRRREWKQEKEEEEAKRTNVWPKT